MSFIDVGLTLINAFRISGLSARVIPILLPSDNSLYVFSDFQKTSNKSIPVLNENHSIKIGLLNGEDEINISVDSCYFNTPFRRKNEIENLGNYF